MFAQRHTQSILSDETIEQHQAHHNQQHLVNQEAHQQVLTEDITVGYLPSAESRHQYGVMGMEPDMMGTRETVQIT